jgi:hypothetical protein
MLAKMLHNLLAPGSVREDRLLLHLEEEPLGAVNRCSNELAVVDKPG